MSKKGFTEGVDILIGGKVETRQETPIKSGRGRPKKEENEKGTRATLIIKNDNLEKLKAIAYWDRITIKLIVNEALENYIKKYKKNQGEVKPKPGR